MIKENTRRFIFDHLALLIAVFGAVFGIYHFFKNPQITQASDLNLLTSRVNYIESDGMLHIQDNITELKDGVKDLGKEQVAQGKDIASILGILNKKLNAN